ncbi:MAG: response regulator [Acidobacteriota bacterium]|nr:response regulator [Acidobacteriota bacterium]
MSAAAENPGGAERLKVLIIDDEPVDRAIFKQYLEADQPECFTYVEAASGREGLRMLENFRPDCVLLDFHLPDLDGLKMIRRLQEGREFLPCAVVMLTGIGSEEIAVEAMKLGVMDYMPKGPASSQALSRTVASAVQRFRLQQEVAKQRQALEQRNQELEAIRAELFEEKERYRTLAEAIPQLVWTADASGQILYGNQRLRDFYGDPDSRLGLLEALVHHEEQTLLRKKWNEATRRASAFETELRLRRGRDQTWRWHLMRAAPIHPAEGGPVRWFGTFTDTEDQKRAEEALRQRQKVDSIGLLAGGIAHDFNNLLVGIMGGASFAADSLDKEHPVYPMLELVLRSSERAAYLTQQLLAYAGKIQLFLEPADISRITRDACDLARASIPDNVCLAIETGDHIPPIKTNAAQMQQVIVNLVINAAEAIGDHNGTVTVRTGHETVPPGQTNILGHELPAGRCVAVEVADSGPGMDEHTQAQIFDPFFTTKFTGRGLGLAAVQGIVRSLGGAIRVVSAKGRGSSFKVLLPAEEQSTQRAEPEEALRAAIGSGDRDLK